MAGKRLRMRRQHKIVREGKIKLPHKRGSNYYCFAKIFHIYIYIYIYIIVLFYNFAKSETDKIGKTNFMHQVQIETT
jgi:hypothetical protein